MVRVVATNNPINLDRFKHENAAGIRSELLPDVDLTLLAKEVGIARTYLSHLVHGRFEPGKKTLMQFAERVSRGQRRVTFEEADRWFKDLRVRAAKLRMKKKMEKLEKQKREKAG